MTLYSYKLSDPKPLPFRIVLSNGATRTDPATFTPTELADAGYVVALPKPEHDVALQRAPVWTGSDWRVDDLTQEELAVAFSARKADMLAALAARRWQSEVGGTTVGGVPIKTDSESTRKITSAYVKADKDPAFTVRWKVDTGVFVTLDAATIIGIGDAVTAHVQACFDNEDVLTTAILTAEDHAALDAVNIETGWPA